MKTLVLCSVAVVSSALDCRTASLWLPTTYPSAGSLVVKSDSLFSNSWYAQSTDVPGAAGGPWILSGPCDAGTTPTGEDCSGVPAWIAQIYSASTMVTYNGIKYSNQYWASASDVPGTSAAWVAKTYCSGSSSSTPSQAPVASAPPTEVVVPSVPGQTSVAVPPQTAPKPASVATTAAKPAGQAVDCSAATQWTAAIYPTPNTQVVYSGSLYTNKWYAESTDTPGVATGPWELKAACLAGTEPGSGGSTAGVDCSGVYTWHPDTTFAAAGEKTVYKHNLYTSKWWIKGTPPSSEAGFTLVGPCITGTESLGYPDGIGMSTESEKTLCTCCKQCANKEKTDPVCLDDVTSEEDCYYAWCPNYNTYNEAECATIIEEGRLGWYSGDLAEGKQMPDRGFMPYIDVCLGTVPNMTEVMEKTGTTHFILAFVVSAKDKCVGSWGGAYDVGSGPSTWDNGEHPLYTEINRLRVQGGDVVVSFGGANGVELADNAACQSGDPVTNLKNAYGEVLDILKLKVLDFDIEGNAAGLAQRDLGWKYRFAAVKELETERPDLHLWWTLPVLPSGLTQEGNTFIQDLFAAGIRFDRLNLMTMDYGELACTGTMHECEQDALTSVAQQVFTAASQAGVASNYGFNSAEDVYPYLGSTPMIGVNDVVSEIYTLENARQSLAIWKSTKPLGLLSMWSMARDSPCDSAYADPSCSSGSVQTEKYEFAKIYAGYPN